jgi:hypothetical protein
LAGVGSASSYVPARRNFHGNSCAPCAQTNTISLIEAKGLGEDVLEALQHANVGQGVSEGFSILFCAIILDRIV